MNELSVGDRIELLEMPNDPCPVEPGTKGTIRFVNPCGHCGQKAFTQFGVDWDNGRSLMLLVPPDRYRVIPKE